MATARFRLLNGTAGTITWRLLATNNRDLGRGAAGYADREACREAVLWLQRHAAELEPVLTRTGPSNWAWKIMAGDRVVVVASRDYQRRIQATQAAAVALELIPAAEMTGLDPRAVHGDPRAADGDPRAVHARPRAEGASG